MKRNTIIKLVYLLGCIIALPGLADVSPNQPGLTLSDVILRAEKYSPNLKGAEAGEQSASQSLRISQSLYYPTLDLTAIDSTGFAASANAPIGFNGLMSSPYRVGLTGGAYTTFSFFDLTREYGVKAAHYDIQAAHEEVKLKRLDVDLKAMNLYMDAVLAVTQRETWKGIQGEVDRLYAVVKKFVRNGQYSDVTSWLLKNQAEQALRRQEDYDLAFQSSTRQIEINIGASPGTLSIGGMESLQSVVSELASHQLAESPLVSRPKVQTQVSQALTRRQSAQNWPRVMGIASAGEMDDTRLVEKQNYSAWIGMTFPIFEGFRISAEEQKAQAQADRSADEANEAQLELADSDARFEQQTKQHQSDITHFQIERDDAVKALKLAEHRYTTFIGDLADVRDSLYSYESAESGLNTARIELYRSILSKALIDGGYLAKSVRQDLN